MNWNIISPDGLADFQDLEAFNALFCSALTMAPKPILKLDLGRVSFIRPAGIIALITAARIWCRQRGGHTLIIKIQPQVYAYLERMDLFEVCEDVLKVSRHIILDEPYLRSYQSKSLLEILPISGNELQNSDYVHHAVARAQQILERWYGKNANVNRLCAVFSEVLTNIVHSEDDGYALIQSYSDHPATGRRIELAVCDAGIGIQASLLSNQQILNEAAFNGWKNGSDFILHALDEGVSSKIGWSDAGRGVGLTIVREKIGSWEQGRLCIRSGSSRVELSQGQRTPQLVDGLAYLPGTQVAISVSAKVFMPN